MAGKKYRLYIAAVLVISVLLVLLPTVLLPARAASYSDTIFYSGYIDGVYCSVQGALLSDTSSVKTYYSTPSPTPRGVAVDASTGIVYYSDFNGNLYKNNLAGNAQTTLLTGYNINDIALDSENQMIYFSGFTQSGSNMGVYRVPMTGGEIATIYSDASGYGTPEGLAFDPINGLLYYADWGETDGFIMEYNTSIGSHSIVLTGYLPNALALDTVSRTLYFSGCTKDFTDYCVNSVSLTTSSVNAIYTATGTDPAPEGVAFDSASGILYYSDSNGGIFKYANGSHTRIISGYIANKLALLITPPALSSTSASALTPSGATLNFTSDKAGTYYYLVYAAADSAPTAAEVRAQGTALAKGTGTALASANAVGVTGLSPSTSYKAYFVVRDANGNLSDVTAIPFTTVAPSLTVTGDSIYTNGYPIIIAAGSNGTLIYFDLDADGEIDSNESAVAMTGPSGNIDTGYDLSSYFLYGTSSSGSVASSKFTMLGGEVCYIFGSGPASGTNVTGNTEINFKGGTAFMLYGGGNYGSVGGSTSITVTGGTITNAIVGGCGAGTVSGDSNVTVTGGTVNGNVYGGGWGGSITGNATVKIGVDADINGTVTYGCAGGPGTVGALSKIVYEVAFYESNGGTKYDADSQYPSQWITDGGHATRPATDPTLSGKVFVDWLKTGELGAYNFSTAVSAPVKLYAEWHSTDATLSASSTVKGETVSLGTPSGTLGSQTAGSVSITSQQAADTSEAGSYITQFNANEEHASVVAVKYSYGASTANFESDSPYGGGPISDGDFFIVKVIAQDGATVNYYKINVTVLDTIAPDISGVTAPANGTYKIGDNLNYKVSFSENVTVSTVLGTPYLTLTVGSTSVHAAYQSGSGTTELTFVYTVASGDLDTDGVALSGNITLNGGTIKDAAGNDAAATFTGSTATGVLIDGVAPEISGASGPAAGTYKTGDTLEFELTFSKAVTVTGSPYIAVNIGGSTKHAVYMSGSGTNSLTFRYTVASGDLDEDGIASGTSVVLNSGAIKDAIGNNAALTFTAPTTSAVLVDGVAPQVSSALGPMFGTYNTGDALEFELTFGEAVTVTGSPYITINIGSSTKHAVYASGSGTYALTFRYTVASGDLDTDGISCGTSVTLNGGTIKDAAGNDAALTFTAPITWLVKVDAVAPGITDVTVPAAGKYKTGDTLEFILTFDEDVCAAGDPYIEINVGGVTKHAVCTGGIGTSMLTFSYTVESGDLDADGISCGTSVTLNGGMIEDAAGNDAALTFTAPSTSAVLVDGVVPEIGGGTGPAAGAYKTGDTLEFELTFGEAVTVTGTPYIEINVGGATKHAEYISGSGTNALTFGYTVAAGDLDADGISCGTSVALNGGTIKDAAGNDAALTFTAPSTSAVLADGVAPEIGGATGPAAGTYKAGDTLEFELTFGEAVTVTGTPYIEINVGGSTKHAEYISGSGTNALTFGYTVAAGDLDADGISCGTSVTMNGGTIKDAAGNDAALTFTAPTTSAVLTDGVAPVVTGVTVPADGKYKTGDTLEFTVTFSENVFINGEGKPYLEIALASGCINAEYLSGSGTNELTFRYTVSDIDVAENGIEIKALKPDTDTAKDAAGNDAILTFAAPNTTDVIIVETFRVIYSSNGADTGSVPSDTHYYEAGENATVSGNTGTLKRTGYTFIGWNTAEDGSGVSYSENDTIAMAGNVTLYARWSIDRVVTGTESGGSTYAPVSAEDAGVLGEVITELGDLQIISPAKLYADMIGEDTTSYLRLTQAPTDNEKFEEVKASVGKDNTVVVSFEVNLEKIYSDGKTETIHDLGENVRVTIKLSAEQLAAITSPQTARLYWYNPKTGALTDMDAVFDLAAGTATFYTNHFSTFIVANVVNENSVKQENPYTGLDLTALAIISVTTLAAATAAVSVILKKKRGI